MAIVILLWAFLFGAWLHHVYTTREIIMDERTGTPYLIRYFLSKPKSKERGRIYLHHILRSDYDRALHDHPWGFTSVLLWGGYTEHTTWTDLSLRPTSGDWKPTFFNGFDEDMQADFNAPTVLKRQAAWRHRLDLKNNKPVWTLVFTTPKQRSWGFWTDLKTFCPWKKYDGRTGICHDE